jgi:peptide/nickel transport system ATP-binding protein
LSATVNVDTRPTTSEHLLEVEDLKVSFRTEDGVVKAVDGVSFTVERGEVVAVVGESGSGKSVTAMTLMGLTRGPNTRFEGRALFDGQDVVGASDEELRRSREADRRADPRPRTEDGQGAGARQGG